jgi:hypothetical protein
MTIKELRSKFAVRYYQWALKEARNEWVNDFGRLRSLSGAFAQEAVLMFDSLEKGEQWDVFQALVKKFHPLALTASGEFMTDHEEKLFQWALEWRRRSSPQERAPGRKPMKRRLFVSATRKRLAQVLGTSHEIFNSQTDYYQTPVDSWSLGTFVDFGKPLSYHHNVTVKSGEQLGAFISVLSWLGIAGQTSFDLVTEGEEDAAAEICAGFCADFLMAVKDLVSGLVLEGR